ncbi:MAG: MbnP family protein [Ferruginibacter sp.]
MNFRASQNCFILLILLLSGLSFAKHPVPKKAAITIIFIHTANGKAIVLNDSSYHNVYGESYTIKKMKYYISNVKLNGKKIKFAEKESYHLINVAGTTSFTFDIDPGEYDKLQFMIGVDSSRNFSGAQTGSLDPLNDMFWTWNNGYVTFKLEGTSPQSPADLNRIEHHIGGYRSPYQTASGIRFSLKLINIKSNSTHTITIKCNLDEYWKAVNENKIANMPVNTVPGAAARKAAENISQMFSLMSID